MKQYMYTLTGKEDIENIADDIYGKDLLASATGLVLELFAAPEHGDLLGHLIAFFIEKYPEIVVDGTFVSVQPTEEGTVCREITLSLMVMEDLTVEKIRCSNYHGKANVNVDPLTGVYTRTEIERFFEEYLKQAQTFRPAVILADIDRLDQINVNLGHDAGDYVMKKIADLFQENLRDTDIIGRWESEKFMILLKNIDTDCAVSTAERIRKSIESENFADAGDVTLSFGITLISSGETKNDVFERADQALKMAKENGRNRFEIL